MGADRSRCGIDGNGEPAGERSGRLQNEHWIFATSRGWYASPRVGIRSRPNTWDLDRRRLVGVYESFRVFSWTTRIG